MKIIVLAGYLGAGKTTLIKYILSQQSEFKIAVIQNEYADEMGIEAPLFQDAEGNTFNTYFELPNGCICCTAKGQLLTAIEYFVKNKPDLQFILIESNGLADPSNMIQELWQDEISNIISLVPCHKIIELKQNEIFLKQIIFANLIVLNYCDKTNQQEQEEALNYLQFLNPLAQIVKTQYSQINLKDIFDIKENIIQHGLNLMQIPQQEHEMFESIILITNNKKAFKEWEILFGILLWESDLQIIRLKGLLQVEDDQFAYQLQGVNDTFEIKQTNIKWISLQDQRTKILIMGKQIKKFDFKKLLKLQD
ncbi:hypothetical protein pb186bvf_015329 [Paramecium bursaria]